MKEKVEGKTKRGKLIVLEGIDGSGKKTQLDLLVRFLKEKNLPVKLADFPQYYTSFFGSLVGRYLKEEFGEADKINPYLASLAYAGDRWEAKSQLEEWLSEGKIIIANRYTGSSSHQAGKIPPGNARDRFLDWLDELEYNVYGIPREDLVLLFDIPAEVGQELVGKKKKRDYASGQKRDGHEKSRAHLRNARSAYLEVAKRYDYWVKINCLDQSGNLKSSEGIHQEVVKILEGKGILC